MGCRDDKRGRRTRKQHRRPAGRSWRGYKRSGKTLRIHNRRDKIKRNNDIRCELLAIIVIFVSWSLATSARSALGVVESHANVIGLHSAENFLTYQIVRHLNSSSALGHYHPTILVLLWGGASRTRALVYSPFGRLSGSRLFGLQGHNHDVSSVFWDRVPPTKRVIIERRILNSEVATRISKTLTLKFLECGSALSDIREIHNGIGIILHISGTVDRHLRGAEPSKDGFQTFAIVDNRHLPVDRTSFLQNDGVVEVENQDARSL